jgi:CheY-like chemotaxis protein
VTIIAVSSYAMPGDPERALEAGCDDYLTKPIDERQLFEMLRLHLGDDG